VEYSNDNIEQSSARENIGGLSPQKHNPSYLAVATLWAFDVALLLIVLPVICANSGACVSCLLLVAVDKK
jgi:hypothetical protein